VSATPISVKGPGLNQTPKTILPLSAVIEVCGVADRGPSAIADLRSERDPLTSSLYAESAHLSESELRALWGDR
jgi:hypothetical protein